MPWGSPARPRLPHVDQHAVDVILPQLPRVHVLMERTVFESWGAGFVSFALGADPVYRRDQTQKLEHSACMHASEHCMHETHAECMHEVCSALALISNSDLGR